MFGLIAAATAPASTFAIVKAKKTKGPITDIVIPVAALDDIASLLVFFLAAPIIVASIVAAGGLGPALVAVETLPASIVPISIFSSILLGALMGIIVTKPILEHIKAKAYTKRG